MEKMEEIETFYTILHYYHYIEEFSFENLKIKKKVGLWSAAALLNLLLCQWSQTCWIYTSWLNVTS